jgi:peptidyl-prolyl cis-trans isomerase D
MAVLGKIREKSIFLIIVIGLALFAFVISGVLDGSNSNTGANDPIAIINSKEIKVDLFRQLVDQTERTYNYSTLQAVNLVWDQLLRNTIFEQEFDELGIDAGKEQIEKIIFNNESIVQDTRFQNESGFFDFGIFTNFIAQLKVENPPAYETWQSQEKNIIGVAKQNIYFDLIKASNFLTDAEIKEKYHLENDNINIEFVKIPFDFINDSLIKITDNDIKDYIKRNSDLYKTDESRGIKYVLFDNIATNDDITDLRLELESLIDERISYNNISKLTDTLPGLRTTKNIKEFIDEYSDSSFDSIYKPKGQLNNEYAEILFGLNPGEVFGPYNDKNNLKISKLIDMKKNGSIRANHILISYTGATRAQSNIERSKNEARIFANKIFRLARRNSSKFEELAKENSDGPTKDRGGDLGFFQEGQMAEEFFYFCKKSRIGKIGLIETEFGFHIIKVIDKADLALIADVTRQIIPSEKTSNQIFRNATQFEMEAKDLENFSEVAKRNNYYITPVKSIKKLEENLPGLYRQRKIVQWAFEKATRLRDIKRFSLNDGGYAVVELFKKNPDGISSIEEVRKSVTEILSKEKKAYIILDRFKSKTSLNSMIEEKEFSVEKGSALNQKNPTLPGSGNEPYIVGSGFSLSVNQTSDLLFGETGIFRIKLLNKNKAVDLGNYKNYGLTIQEDINQLLLDQVFEALRSNAEIEDNRSLYY